MKTSDEVEFACPHCDNQLRLAGKTSGVRVRCPGCNRLLTVPLQEDECAGREKPPFTWHDLQEEDVNNPAPAKRRLVRPLFIGGGIAVGLLLVLLIVKSLGIKNRSNPKVTSSSEIPARFNPRDVHETARWAGETLRPLDATTKIENGIVRADTLNAETVKIKSVISRIVGQSVSWEMGCSVHETGVTLAPLKFRMDGKPTLFANVTDEHVQIVMMIVDQNQTKVEDVRFGDHPDLRGDFFHVDIPAGITRAEASKLIDRVIVNAKIKEVEIGNYKNKNHQDRFLLYVNLTDVKLSVASK